MAPKAKATTYSVTTLSGPGICDVVSAITAINNAAAYNGCAAPTSSNTISMSAGTYSLIADLPAITTDGDLSIVGAGPSLTIVDGGGLYSGVDINPPSGNNNYLLSNLTLQNFIAGSTSYPIIGYDGNFTLDNVIARNNACQAGSGAPVCVLLGSSSGNDSSIVISNSAFYNNTAFIIIGLGNGINEESPGGSVSANIFNNTFSTNNGVVMGVANRVDGETVVVNLTNNTIANNSVSDFPNAGPIVINFSGGSFDTYSSVVNIKSNIFYSNTNNSSSLNCLTPALIGTNGSLVSLGGNISSDATCNSYFTASNDLVSTDPLINSLYLDNGTYVRPLASNSPAIGNAIASGAPSVDQRGVSRPQNSTYDSGAYEYQIFTPTPTPTPTPKPSSAKLANTGLDVRAILILASLFVASGILGTYYSVHHRSKDKLKKQINSLR